MFFGKSKKEESLMQTQLLKQKEIQLKAQTLSNESFMSLIASLDELIRIYISPEKLSPIYIKLFKTENPFNYYNYGPNCSKENLILSINNQLTLFQDNVLSYCKRYKQYDFPSNFNKENFITLFNFYASLELEPNINRIFTHLLGLLSNPSNYKNNYYEIPIEQQAHDDQANWGVFTNSIPAASAANNKLCKEVSDNYKKGKTKIKVKIGGDYHDNPSYKYRKQLEKVNGTNNDILLNLQNEVN